MSSSDYEVGYRKPPKNRKFQKGKSGNPLGRPRVLTNIPLLVDRQLREKVTVTLNNGRRKRIMKAQAIAMQAVNKAASGDGRALMLIIQLQMTAEQLRQAFDKEVLDNLNFEELSTEQLNRLIQLTASPEALKFAGIEEPLDMKMAKKFLSGRTPF